MRFKGKNRVHDDSIPSGAREITVGDTSEGEKE
jgi:hypothetical protein